MTAQDVVDMAHGAAQIEMQGEVIGQDMSEREGNGELAMSRAAQAVPLPDTITVDGVERPTTNSEGRQIHYSDDGVRNFWRWFDAVRSEGLGDPNASSKDAGGIYGADNGITGLDGQGRPRVFYHGTADAFDAFDLAHQNRKDAGWLGRGVYLTTDPRATDSYANLKAGREAPMD